MLQVYEREVKTCVALLAEGVGRNDVVGYGRRLFGVALLAEGVGRNKEPLFLRYHIPVALLAEGVGRNMFANGYFGVDIEVALLAEGVGRNSQPAENVHLITRRPPRGGRG